MAMVKVRPCKTGPKLIGILSFNLERDVAYAIIVRAGIQSVMVNCVSRFIGVDR